jgi:hypothetical protein
VSRTAVVITSAARFSALLASLRKRDMTTPEAVPSIRSCGQCSRRSNIDARSSTSTACDTLFSSIALLKVDNPRTTNRPMNAAGSHSAAPTSRS